MDKVKIAKELVRIAKELIAKNDDEMMVEIMGMDFIIKYMDEYHFSTRFKDSNSSAAHNVQHIGEIKNLPHYRKIEKFLQERSEVHDKENSKWGV